MWRSVSLGCLLCGVTIAGCGRLDFEDTAPLTVTVLSEASDGAPDPTVDVALIDRSGRVVHRGKPDDRGRLVAHVGLVDVHLIRIRPGDSANTLQIRLQSVLGVFGGASLTLGAPLYPPARGTGLAIGGTFTPVPNASDYFFYSTCFTGADTGPSQASLYADLSCLPSPFHVLGVALMPEVRWKYAWTTGVGPGFHVPDMKDMEPFDIKLLHLPQATPSVSRYTVVAPYYSAYGHSTSAKLFVRDGDTAIFNSSYPPGAEGMTSVAATMNGGYGAQQRYSSLLPGDQSQATMDLALLPLPSFNTEVKLEERTLRWSQIGEGAPDGRVTTLTSSHVVDGITYQVTWQIIDGSASSELPLPSLPADLATLDPTAHGPYTPSVRIAYADWSDLDGYHELLDAPVEALLQEPDNPYWHDGPFEVRVSSGTSGAGTPLLVPTAAEPVAVSRVR